MTLFNQLQNNNNILITVTCLLEFSNVGTKLKKEKTEKGIEMNRKPQLRELILRRFFLTPVMWALGKESHIS